MSKQYRMFTFAVVGCAVFAFSPAILLADSRFKDLAGAALARTHVEVAYDGSYLVIDYPNGDVPSQVGVCTDLVIRSYRALGIDLQQLLHEDIKDHFNDYPSKRIWGLTKPDTNIDHRRVPNLQTFFERYGETLVVSNDASDYKSGDLVTWVLPGNLPHIGIVSTKVSTTGVPLIVHNIGEGPKLENMLFNFPISGHYRYWPNTIQPAQH